ncbi:MAG: peptide chain release factor N(5)-glutamine methyltransferase [Clostridia bacterium]|nr:peptide chain release factor N(5)-glutamine methyltransferase [Clostridia bacterium]
MLNKLLAKLKEAGIDDADTTLDVLCAYVKKTDYSSVRLSRITGSLSLTDGEKEKLDTLVSARCGGEPLEYITGEREFYGFLFKCRKNVLIPRNDTEILVDAALEFLKDGDALLDLCTGTGCVGISIAKTKKIKAVLADISKDALECAKENAERLLPQGNAEVICHNVFCDIPKGLFDAVTANPPYITAEEMTGLPADVKNEPSLALFGGEDGLDFYRTIAKRYRQFIKKGGRIFFEVGAKQSESVAEILEKNGYSDIETKKDYGNINRVVSARNDQ